jgi:hypothetical protein
MKYSPKREPSQTEIDELRAAGDVFFNEPIVDER